MNFPHTPKQPARLDEEGRIILPGDLASLAGLEAGGEAAVFASPEGILLRPPVGQLRKIYIEPTSCCNLACRTCIRNAWDEPIGFMSVETFERIVEDLATRKPAPSVFFGGFGEPLTHPHIANMVKQAARYAARVELITNGLLLDESCAVQLIEAGLTTLWVSLDGASPETYADVRLSESLQRVLHNMSRYRDLFRQKRGGDADMGVVFVAMKRNIDELPKLLALSTRVGIARYLVTNVLPYTRDMCEEVLYHRSIDRINWQPSSWHPRLDMPEIDLTPVTREALFQAWSMRPGSLFKKTYQCPFISQRATAIAWDGSLSPCLALLHSHQSYLFELERMTKRCVYGNLNEVPLSDLWQAAAYRAFREKVEQFDFSPCVYCASCEMAERNQEDCFGNTFPVCGGCLWAQGIVQCP